MKYIQYLLFLVLLAPALTSCETEIELELSGEEPRIVFEGWITDQAGPYEVRITRTTDYFSSESNPPVTGATVVVSDDQGNSETLLETSPGVYHTSTLQGEIGRTYFLNATIGNEVYEASAYLPRINPIDTTVYAFVPAQGFLEEGYYITSFAVEPAGIGDFYRFRFYENDSLYDGPFDYFLTDDRFADGQLATFQLPYVVALGDTGVIEIQSITNEVYDYYLTLFQQLSSGGSPFGAPPANLPGNITNNAMGIFGAMGIARDTVIIR